MSLNRGRTCEKRIPHYVAYKAPLNEGKTIIRRDVLSPKNVVNQMTHTFTGLRRFFDAMARQLVRRDESKRVRYLRQTEDPITLNDIIDLGVKTDREIGIFVDKYKTDPGKFKHDKYTQSKRYTAICLYAGNKVYFPPKGGSSNVGASIGFPPGGENRYRFVAHYHPTEKAFASQIQTDMRVANEKVEMVVTKGSLVLFYKNSFCYNVKTNVSGRSTYTPMLKKVESDEHLPEFNINVNTPMTLKIINGLYEAQSGLDKRRIEIEGDKFRASLSRYKAKLEEPDSDSDDDSMDAMPASLWDAPSTLFTEASAAYDAPPVKIDNMDLSKFSP